MSKKMCLGTFLNILIQAKLAKIKQNNLISSLLGIIGDYSSTTDAYHSRLKSGARDLASINELKDIDKSLLTEEIKSKIIPLLDQKLTRQLILAFKDVLNDDNIDDNVLIGYESGFTKKDIISSTKFDLASLLSNVFYYCGVLVENTPYKENIKEVSNIDDYIHQFDANVDDIILIEKIETISSKLELTANSKNFINTFKEVSSPNLPLKNNNQLKTFILDIGNHEFDYESIKKFIQQNIGRYVFSRAKRNKYKVEDNIENLGIDAIKAYKNRISTKKETNHFNEIMLYLFLECVLNAPKIYSKMELQTTTSDEYTSSSAGIHLLLLKNGPTIINQYVLGATDSLGNLKDAIDSSFKQIEALRDNRGKEYNLIESTVLNYSFDAKTTEELESIILPQKNTKAKKPEQAFGIFLGYTIDIPNKNELTPAEFENSVKEKMEQDINDLTPYIISKIRELDLSGNSFYIYVLPFNNVEIDKNEIMQKALEV